MVVNEVSQMTDQEATSILLALNKIFLIVYSTALYPRSAFYSNMHSSTLTWCSGSVRRCRGSPSRSPLFPRDLDNYRSHYL